MKVCQLGSGSKGNCTFISSEKTSILIDAGLNWSHMKRVSEAKGIDLSELKAIFITHCHQDHWKYAFKIASKIEKPARVFLTKEQWEYLKEKNYRAVKEIEMEVLVNVIATDERVIKFHPFEVSRHFVSHDSIDTCAYIVSQKNTKIGVITDLGYISRKTMDIFKKCTLLILEANHDVNMLLSGKYPEVVIHRILSKEGHLSNTQAVEFAETLKGETTKHVILAHVSQENNSIEKINEVFSRVINDNSPIFHVSNQETGSSLFYL